MNWMLIVVLVAIIILGVFAYFASKAKKGKKQEPDYRTFFILGICWIPLGFATDNHIFSIVGAAFLVLGLANKDKWKESSKRKLTKEERKFRLQILIGLGVLMVLGAILMLLYRN